MTEIDVKAKNIKNDFLPRCRSKLLSLSNLATIVKGGFCHIDDLPPKLRKHVLGVIEKRHGRGSGEIGEKNEKEGDA